MLGLLGKLPRLMLCTNQRRAEVSARPSARPGMVSSRQGIGSRMSCLAVTEHIKVQKGV